MLGGGQWTLGGGRWAVDVGRWTLGGGRWTLGGLDAEVEAECACVVRAAECAGGGWSEGGGTVGACMCATRAAGGVRKHASKAEAVVGRVCTVRAVASMGGASPLGFSPFVQGVPDIAAQDVFFRVFLSGKHVLVDNTSASSPTFVGIVLLLNDAPRAGLAIPCLLCDFVWILMS